MARSRLIPTEATPVSSRANTPEPSKKTSTTLRASKAAATTSSVKTQDPLVVNAKVPKARPSQVANGFIALPVALLPKVPGLQGVTQHIYIRRKVDSTPGEEEAAEQSTSSISASKSTNVLFAVNLPHGTTEASIKQGIEGLIKARSSNISTSPEKGKGKASDLSNGQDIVDSVEFVHSVPPSHRNNKSVIETEGIVHPSTLLKKQEMEQLSKMENLSKKQKKALQLQLEQQKQELEEDKASRIHPLFVSTDITTQEALDHLFPSSSTLKAHITLSSSKAMQILLNDKATSGWTMTTWPSTSWTSSISDSRQVKTRDELLFDMARPAAESVKLHVDDWMKAFDEANPGKTALARRAAAAAAAEAELPKSKRAAAREAAAKAAKQAEFARKKAIKKRRIYDDDFDEPEADADGWVTVTAGGLKGRSAAEAGEEGEFEDEEEVQQAELEGFLSGKRSVGIARKEFIKEKEKEIQEERKKALAALNNKLGIDGADNHDTTAMAVDGAGVGLEDEDDVSRGGGRGRKKKMKKSRGIEVNMYGFHRREESRKSKFLLILLEWLSGAWANSSRFWQISPI